MSDAKHTPTPWFVGGVTIWDTSGRSLIAECPQPEWLGARKLTNREANAAHIVKCVNAHDAFVAALRDLLARAEAELADPEDVWEVGAAHAALAKAGAA